MQSVVSLSQGSKWRMGLGVGQNKWTITSISPYCFAIAFRIKTKLFTWPTKPYTV